MDTYSIIYHGPGIDQEDKVSQRIVSALVARYPFSQAEINRRLSQLPFTLISGLSKNQAARHQLFLKTMGAKIETKAEPERELEEYQQVDMQTSWPGGRYFTRGALTSVAYSLFSGLLIIMVIFLAGIMQIAFAHLLSAPEPIWLLSASGWATIALAVFILLGILVLRLGTIMNILKLPDLSTPLSAVRSFYQAINTKHWEKALICLCFNPEMELLANLDKDKALAYLKNVSRKFVLPANIPADSSSLLNLEGDNAVLRFEVSMVGRKPLSDGTRLEKKIIDISRFKKIDGKWFLVDGFIFGQRDPLRLPLPACRQCGTEIAIGQVNCDNCSAKLPPYAQETDKWLAPQRKPDLAALLSALVPGLGQTYNGQPLKGAVIGATFWMVLPWAAGVIDAMVVSERINRKGSQHDLYSKPLVPVLIHAAAFLVVVALLFLNLDKLPLMHGFFQHEPAQELVDDNLTNTSVVARFRGMDGNYSILFPFHWNVQEDPVKKESANSDETNQRGNLSVSANSEDGLSTIVITTLPIPAGWQSCPQAREASRKMEEKNEEIANIECGSKGGREQYRIDSYTPNRLWRRTLLVISFPNELVAISFVCPIEQQSTMVKVFEDVANSIRFVHQSDTSIRR